MLHEQTVELNQMTEYCQQQAQAIIELQDHIKTLNKQDPKSKPIEPNIEILKKHINDY